MRSICFTLSISEVHQTLKWYEPERRNQSRETTKEATMSDTTQRKARTTTIMTAPGHVPTKHSSDEQLLEAMANPAHSRHFTAARLWDDRRGGEAALVVKDIEREMGKKGEDINVAASLEASVFVLNGQQPNVPEGHKLTTAHDHFGSY